MTFGKRSIKNIGKTGRVCHFAGWLDSGLFGSSNAAILQQERKRVLDIGCGNGKYIVFLKSLGFEPRGLIPVRQPRINREAINDNQLISQADIYEYELRRSAMIGNLDCRHSSWFEGKVQRAIAQIKRLCGRKDISLSPC
jgi:hypothetical protein